MLKLLLSFAVGSLLGDVFLHLLPEAWATVNRGENICKFKTSLSFIDFTKHCTKMLYFYLYLCY